MTESSYSTLTLRDDCETISLSSRLSFINLFICKKWM